MREVVKLAGILFIITSVAAILLGFTNMATRDVIAQQLELENTEARKSALPIAEEFEEVKGKELENALLTDFSSIDEVYQGKDVYKRQLPTLYYQPSNISGMNMRRISLIKNVLPVLVKHYFPIPVSYTHLDVYKRQVVGMATCGIAAGARPVLTTIMDEISRLEIKNVTVAQTGCIGACRFEPIVEVFSPEGEKVTYIKMNPDKAKEMVEIHIMNDRVLDEYTMTVIDGKVIDPVAKDE